jgi:hypothetical protein
MSSSTHTILTNSLFCSMLLLKALFWYLPPAGPAFGPLAGLFFCGASIPAGSVAEVPLSGVLFSREPRACCALGVP